MKEIDEDLKINATNEQVKLAKEFAEVCTALAHEFAGKLIAAGMKCDGAGSLAAHAMIDAAWRTAKAGVIAEGREPNPDNFIAAATSHVKPTQLKWRLKWGLVEKPT